MTLVDQLRNLSDHAHPNAGLRKDLEKSAREAAKNGYRQISCLLPNSDQVKADLIRYFRNEGLTVIIKDVNGQSQLILSW